MTAETMIGDESRTALGVINRTYSVCLAYFDLQDLVNKVGYCQGMSFVVALLLLLNYQYN